MSDLNIKCHGCACRDDEIEQLRAALRPFAEYGAALRGQNIRGDNVLAELWGHSITVNALIKAAKASPLAVKGED